VWRRKGARKRQFTLLSPDLVTTLIEIVETISRLAHNAGGVAHHDAAADIHFLSGLRPGRGRENFKIVLPAAISSLILLTIVSLSENIGEFDIPAYDLIQIIPYIIVLVGGIVGINVLIVLLLGIVSGTVIMLATGASSVTDLIGGMGAGASGMFETAMVAILVSAICALIREDGGFDALLGWLYKIFKGKKGGQLGMGVLVVLLDIATANNTVAIVMANPIASEMSGLYGISNRKTASILDTFSCIAQGIIPYGAQMLVAISGAAVLGSNVSAFEIIPLLFYPWLLLLSSLCFIAFDKKDA